MIDTNVLIYPHDMTDRVKQAAAIELIEKLAREGRLSLSVQALHEFYSVATNPRKALQMPHERAVRIIADLIEVAFIVPLTHAVTRRALYGVERYRLAFWDALIWAAACDHGIPLLYTEDFSRGATLEGVTFIDLCAELRTL